MNKKTEWLLATPFVLTACMAPDHPSNAQMNFLGLQAVPVGYCQITLTGTATNLTIGCAGSVGGGIPLGAHYISIQVESANARYRDDGTAPTSAIGMQLFSSSTVPAVWYMGTLSDLQFIAVSGSPVLDVSFYK